MRKNAGKGACASDRERTGVGDQCRLTVMQQEERARQQKEKAEAKRIKDKQYLSGGCER